MKASNIRQGVTTAAAAVAAGQSAPPDRAIVVDSRGRRLQLRELTLLQEQDVLCAMGPHGDNQHTLRRALFAARVEMIDDDPIAVPATWAGYRGMMTQVGTAGLLAVIEHLSPPEPVGEPIAVFEGELAEHRLISHGGGFGLFRIVAEGQQSEADFAKN